MGGLPGQVSRGGAAVWSLRGGGLRLSRWICVDLGFLLSFCNFGNVESPMQRGTAEALKARLQLRPLRYNAQPNVDDVAAFFKGVDRRSTHTAESGNDPRAT